MSFIDTLKELVGKATKGPWEHYEGDWLLSKSPELSGWASGQIAQFFYKDETDFPNRNNNAALIVHLVNHAEDIVALVEALERIREEDRTGPEVYESAPTAGRPHRMRCVGNAMGRSGEIASAALSRLEAKP